MSLTSLIPQAVDGIIIADKRGIIASFDPSAERLFGNTATEVCGQNVWMLMPSPDREAHNDHIARYLRTGEKHIIGIGCALRTQCRVGRMFPISLDV